MTFSLITHRKTSPLNFFSSMFYSYTYDISLLILVILMAEKEMMIASKSLFEKREKNVIIFWKKSN